MSPQQAFRLSRPVAGHTDRSSNEGPENIKRGDRSQPRLIARCNDTADAMAPVRLPRASYRGIVRV
jgi:hypothetical protein